MKPWREPGLMDRVMAWLAAALFAPVAVPIPVRVERDRDVAHKHGPRRS